MWEHDTSAFWHTKSIAQSRAVVAERVERIDIVF
jgi:hypothetical protein